MVINPNTYIQCISEKM